MVSAQTLLERSTKERQAIRPHGIHQRWRDRTREIAGVSFAPPEFRTRPFRPTHSQILRTDQRAYVRKPEALQSTHHSAGHRELPPVGTDLNSNLPPTHASAVPPLRESLQCAFPIFRRPCASDRISDFTVLHLRYNK